MWTVDLVYEDYKGPVKFQMKLKYADTEEQAWDTVNGIRRRGFRIDDTLYPPYRIIKMTVKEVPDDRVPPQ